MTKKTIACMDDFFYGCNSLSVREIGGMFFAFFLMASMWVSMIGLFCIFRILINLL